MRMPQSNTCNTHERLKESVVKTSLATLNWEELHAHLLDLSFSCDHLTELRGHIRRFSRLICKHTCKDYEQTRRQFFRLLQAFVRTQLGNKAETDVLKEVHLIRTIEHGYRGILNLLATCSISQRPAPVRVSASISRACYEYHELMQRCEISISKAQYLNFPTGIHIESDHGNKISPDTVVDGLSETVAMTLVMEAYRNDWFVDDIVVLPYLPNVGDKERYESGSTQLLALCWRQWQRIEKRRRFLDGDLLRHSDKNRPDGLPDQIRTLIEYRPEENGLSEREVYDFLANIRIKDRLLQTFMEIETETGIPAHMVGIGNGAALPPKQWVSTEECHASISLSELLGYSHYQ